MNWIAVLAGLASAAMLVAVGGKWELKRRHVWPWSAFIGLAVFGAIALVERYFPSIPQLAVGAACVIAGIGTTIGTILFFFFRDPERKSPDRNDLIISPADGTVIYIKQIEAANFPFAVKNGRQIPLAEFTTENLISDRGVQIGIAMNYLNVHVNRSPIQGRITMLKAVPGLFESLKHIESLLVNERVLMVFEANHLKVGIVQIASRLVRRIVPFVKAGQEVEQGQRVGRITFGSQVDVILPFSEDLKIVVQVGDEVIAGVSPLIELGTSNNK